MTDVTIDKYRVALNLFLHETSHLLIHYLIFGLIGHVRQTPLKFWQDTIY